MMTEEASAKLHRYRSKLTRLACTLIEGVEEVGQS